MSYDTGFPASINTPFDYTIVPEKEGLYAVLLTGRCRSAKDDLRVEFDGRSFRGVSSTTKSSVFDVPASWNGALLKGQTQTIVFILWLAPIQYTLKFISRGTAEITSAPRLLFLPGPRSVSLLLNEQAKDANGRPWFTVALVDLPLASCAADVSVGWHWWDGDDVKLIVDGKIEPNLNSRRYRDWLWTARFLDKFIGARRETKIINRVLPRGVHYFEFWADRTPTLHTVSLDLGVDRRFPTREAPRWTGNNFSDDTDQLLLARAIFGEARGVADERAKVAVGWTMRNRIDIGDWRGGTYREVILKDAQYSAFNQGDNNRPYVEDPFCKLNQIDVQAWFGCYRIAEQVIANAVADPTGGATNYYSDGGIAPAWAIQQNFKVKIGPFNFYRV